MSEPDLAALFRARYLAHCEDCRRAGLPVPTPDEWAELVEAEIRDADEAPGADP